ncbi:hypothetical protein [Pedobacter terrae]|nr:hypothetical protein [Pedobacter terrae]
MTNQLINFYEEGRCNINPIKGITLLAMFNPYQPNTSVCSLLIPLSAIN